MAKQQLQQIQYGYGARDDQEDPYADLYDPAQVAATANYGAPTPPAPPGPDDPGPPPDDGSDQGRDPLPPPPPGGTSTVPGAPPPTPGPAASDAITADEVAAMMRAEGVPESIIAQEAGSITRYGRSGVGAVIAQSLQSWMARGNGGTGGGGAAAGSGGAGRDIGQGLGAGGSEALSMQLIQQLIANLTAQSQAQSQQQSATQAAQAAQQEQLRQSILAQIQQLIAEGGQPIGDVSASPQAAAFSAATQRGTARARSEQMERRAAQNLSTSGPAETDILGLQDSASLAQGAYEAQLTDKLLTDKKDRLEKALTLGAGVMQEADRLEAQRQLNQLNAAIQANQQQLSLTLGLLHNMQFYDSLGYDIGAQEGGANASAAGAGGGG